MRKYLRKDKETGKNTLSVERHMELFNRNDEDHTYLDCVEDNIDILL